MFSLFLSANEQRNFLDNEQVLVSMSNCESLGVLHSKKLTWSAQRHSLAVI